MGSEAAQRSSAWPHTRDPTALAPRTSATAQARVCPRQENGVVGSAGVTVVHGAERLTRGAEPTVRAHNTS